MTRPKPALPIDAALGDIVDAVRRHPALIVRAPPGAGKTTRVPPALLDAGLAGAGQIIILEPRRLAARSAARRMAQERGQEIGDEVGYQVRFERRAGPGTKVLAVTPGILLRWLQDDPFLAAAAIVVFDEFHERGIETDLALGMLRLVQQSVRPELKLIVMSATLVSAGLREYLGGCPVIESEGRCFPVDIAYRPRLGREPLSRAAARVTADTLRGCFRTPSPLPLSPAAGERAEVVKQPLSPTDGDVLVFLPGMREIRQTMRLLDAAAVDVFPLHGDLPLDEQDAALAPSPRRKVILATNVAESSITVEGVSAVVDTGYARLLRFDRNLGLDRLDLCPISQASAAQRTGRAGRTRPGVCIRLWSEAWQRNLAEQTEPEIRRVDLAGPLLHLLALGETNAAAFPWLDPPPPEHVEHAQTVLRRLGAMDEAGKITPTGRLLSRLPVQPRLGRLLIEGQRLGIPERAALAAALLSERDVFIRPDGGERGPRREPTRSDVLERVEALEAHFAGKEYRGRLGAVNRGAARFVQHAQRQLVRILRAERVGQAFLPAGLAGKRLSPDHQPGRQECLPHDEALLRALLAAYPDRVARRRQPGARRGVMVGGRGVALAPSSGVLDGELFLAIDVDAGAQEAQVRMASQVQRDWLPTEKLTWTTDVSFDEATEKVTARRRLLYDDLVLEETAAALPDDGRVEALLLAEARARLPRVLPQAGSDGDRFLTRLRWLAARMPELRLPPLDDEELVETLRWLAPGRRSFADLRAAPWVEMIRGRLAHAQAHALDREAPERLEVPSGSHITLQYDVERPPVLAVRIQEVFGWKETPRLAGGRVPLLLHLLAPNYRPQQITDDLASFWKNTYPLVRKELRARYPKHPWPEDPLNAKPIHK